MALNGKCGNSPFLESGGKTKWCKASWYLKGTSGKAESEAIPRSWVSKSQSIVKCPPSNVNFKSTIIECASPPERGMWTSYILISCTRSVDTLAEAQQLETEMSDSESDENAPKVINSENDENHTPLGRGKRTKKRVFDDQYDVDNTTEGDDVESEVRRDKVMPIRFIEGGLGDTTGSAIQLTLSGGKVFPAGIHKSVKTNMANHAVVSRRQDPNADERCSQGEVPDSEEDIRNQLSLVTQSKSKTSVEVTDVRMKRLLVEFFAESKVRHNEVLDRLQQLETKMDTIVKVLKRPRPSIDEESHEDNSQFHNEDIEGTSADELDIERQFCVELPVRTFEEFARLEEELGESKRKRKSMRELFESLGGRTENDVMLKCISKVIQRPQLAQHFNCGGSTKPGSLVQEPEDKRNFMGSRCQEIILRVLRGNYPMENVTSIRARASNVLKRSNGLKGGTAYKARRDVTIPSPPVNS